MSNYYGFSSYTRLSGIGISFTAFSPLNLSPIITSFTGIVTKIGYTNEFTVYGDNFTEGGDPLLYIDGELVSINSYTNNYIRFYLPILDTGTYTLRVVNGFGELYYDEINFIIYRGNQTPSNAIGNELCSRQATLSLVYDEYTETINNVSVLVRGITGKYGKIQTVTVNPNMLYEYVRLKYNSNFDWETGGEVTLDGIELLEDDKVYLADQTDPSENGIYTVKTDAWKFFVSVDDDIFVDLGARATDTTDGDLTRTIVTYKPNLDFSKVGFYTITYYVINSAGILSTVIRKVKVIKASASIVPTDSYQITNLEIINAADKTLFR